MTTQKCPRCGKNAAQAKIIPLSGTSRGAAVCPDCYAYLTESPVAYERFVVLERAKSKKTNGGKL